MFPSILKDEIQLFPLLYNRNKSDDSIMPDHFQVPYLSLNTSKPIPIKAFNFFISLDGIVSIIFFSNGQRDHRKSSFSNMRHYFERLKSVIT